MRASTLPKANQVARCCVRSVCWLLGRPEAAVNASIAFGGLDGRQDMG